VAGLLTPYGATSLVRAPTTGPVDPYSVDETPLVTVTINGVETDLITRYCYDTDLLQLGDPFSVDVPDPHGRFANVVEGSPITLQFASPQVGNGQRVPKVTGVVTQVRRSVDRGGASTLNVAGADLGWFLVNCDAPIWKRLEGRTFGGLYDLFVDPSWGFTGIEFGRDRNTKIKLGGNYARSVATLGDQDRPPIVQVEPGDKPADYFIQFAKLANKLVNVTADGKLCLFKPRYDTPVAYTFYHYRDLVKGKNNVQRATLTRSLATRYTKAICVGTTLIPQSQGVDPNNPNTNNFRGQYVRPVGVLAPSYQAGLPFTRLVAFADPDRLSSAQASARAQWMVNRGDFDAWVYEIEVRGHSQSGNFYEPDTMCEVHDEFFGLDGKFYVSAVRYDRDDRGGTRSTLQIRLPNLLAA
jgi:prophage tail gpP-like protein